MVKTIIFTKDFIEYAKYNEELAYGNFLDRFRSCTKAEQQEIIKDRPINEDELPVTASVLAASVEVLVKEYNLEMPDWVMDKKYRLEKPYYSFVKNPDYQKYLSETSLPEFKKRNLFLGDNAMSRV